MNRKCAESHVELWPIVRIERWLVVRKPHTVKVRFLAMPGLFD